jgi:dipeptide/tripeptide permease
VVDSFASHAVIEFSERLSYFGIATSLMLYLTKVLQEEMKVAAKNVNYWMSVTTLMPLLGGFLADGYLGRFSTVVLSTVVYLLVSCCGFFCRCI